MFVFVHCHVPLSHTIEDVPYITVEFMDFILDPPRFSFLISSGFVLSSYGLFYSLMSASLQLSSHAFFTSFSLSTNLLKRLPWNIFLLYFLLKSWLKFPVLSYVESNFLITLQSAYYFGPVTPSLCLSHSSHIYYLLLKARWPACCHPDGLVHRFQPLWLPVVHRQMVCLPSVNICPKNFSPGSFCDIIKSVL